VFENRVLRRVFGPYGHDVTREWRNIHNEEHYAVFSSPKIIQMISKRIR
jgi:hypothetical protein